MDLGFDVTHLATTMGMLDRYTDEDLPLPAEQVPRVREYFKDRMHALRSHH